MGYMDYDDYGYGKYKQKKGIFPAKELLIILLFIIAGCIGMYSGSMQISNSDYRFDRSQSYANIVIKRY